MLVQEALKTKTRNVPTIRPDQTLRDAAALLAEGRPGVLVVSDEAGRVLGAVSEWDVLQAVAHQNICDGGLPVSMIMRNEVVVCRPTDRLDAVRDLMAEQRRRHVPVVADGSLVGVISLGEVLYNLFEEAQLGQDLLREYFLGLGYH